MIEVDFLKFFHLAFVMLFIGLLVANYCLAARSIANNKINSILKLSLWLDRICIFLFVFLPITGFFLVHPKGFFL